MATLPKLPPRHLVAAARAQGVRWEDVRDEATRRGVVRAAFGALLREQRGPGGGLKRPAGTAPLSSSSSSLRARFDEEGSDDEENRRYEADEGGGGERRGYGSDDDDDYDDDDENGDEDDVPLAPQKSSALDRADDLDGFSDVDELERVGDEALAAAEMSRSARRRARHQLAVVAAAAAAPPPSQQRPATTQTSSQGGESDATTTATSKPRRHPVKTTNEMVGKRVVLLSTGEWGVVEEEGGRGSYMTVVVRTGSQTRRVHSTRERVLVLPPGLHGDAALDRIVEACAQVPHVTDLAVGQRVVYLKNVEVRTGIVTFVPSETETSSFELNPPRVQICLDASRAVMNCAPETLRMIPANAAIVDLGKSSTRGPMPRVEQLERDRVRKSIQVIVPPSKADPAWRASLRAPTAEDVEGDADVEAEPRRPRGRPPAASRGSVGVSGSVRAAATTTATTTTAARVGAPATAAVATTTTTTTTTTTAASSSSEDDDKDDDIELRARPRAATTSGRATTTTTSTTTTSGFGTTTAVGGASRGARREYVYDD